MRTIDCASRDKDGKVAFYVPLFKRPGITLRQYDDYWRDVHGPVCARLPGQHQYWQWHVGHVEGGLWPEQRGIEYRPAPEEQFDGIAELTFRSDENRNVWFKASAILMDDEHNIFRKAIGYNTHSGNSITYADGIENGAPNGETTEIKLHVMMRQQKAVQKTDFRNFLTQSFAPAAGRNKNVLKLRVHTFEEVVNDRPDAAGVSHTELPESQYQGAVEIAFSNRLEMELFFASSDFSDATRDLPKFVRTLHAFPERSGYAFVYADKMTLAGQRGSSVAQLIHGLGATNQIRSDIQSLMVGRPL